MALPALLLGVRYHFGDYMDDVMTVADALEWERFDIMLANLNRIQAHVLLITGASGTLKKWPYFPGRCEAVNQLHWVELPGNHHLHPEPVAVINDFFSQHA